MLNFNSDYLQAAHENILARIANEAANKYTGYSQDEICESARKRIKAACENDDLQVHFLVGGTAANTLALDALLGKCGAVISAKTGHIAVHEAGAIEATGHKVIELNATDDGRLQADDVRAYMQNFTQDETAAHMVQPEVVYISQSTENGAIYSKNEMLMLRKVCDDYNLRLFLDGARLGYALMANDADVSLPFLSRTCDAFYIGGTKVGALFGEALVFCNDKFSKGFLTLMKKRGALLAKGYLLGIQFDELFKDNLYFKISAHAIECANIIKKHLTEKGYELFCNNPTNQTFVVLSEEKFKQISQYASMQIWQPPENGKVIVRIATSWATDINEVKELLKLFD